MTDEQGRDEPSPRTPSREQPHTADPAALEDPVHHDVAEHELEDEQISREGDAADRGESSSDDASSGAADEDAADGGAEATRTEPVDIEGSGPGWPELAGESRVDAALQRLAEVNSLEPSEHVPVYEGVHRRLQDILADLDDEATAHRGGRDAP